MALTSAQKARLGVFILGSGTLLVATLAALSGSALLQPRKVYYMHFRGSVSGLEEGAPVKWKGVRVGRIEEISIDPGDIERVVVRAGLRRDAPVRQDTTAEQAMVGITGLKFVELVGGSQDAPELPSGSVLATRASPLEEITGRAESLAEKMELLLNNLNRLTGDENREQVHLLLANANQLAANSAGLLGGVGRQMETAVGELGGSSREFRATARQLQELLAENREELRMALGSFAKAMGEARAVLEGDHFRGIVRDLAGTLAGAHEAVGDGRARDTVEQMGRLADAAARLADDLEGLVGDNSARVTRAVEDLETAASNLREVTRELRENPSLLLGLGRPATREVK